MTPAQIRATRDRFDLTQSRLGELAGTSGTMVAQYEKRSPKVPADSPAYLGIVRVLGELLAGRSVAVEAEPPPPSRVPFLQRGDPGRGVRSSMGGRGAAMPPRR